jgi:hypothetical protein
VRRWRLTILPYRRQDTLQHLRLFTKYPALQHPILAPPLPTANLPGDPHQSQPAEGKAGPAENSGSPCQPNVGGTEKEAGHAEPGVEEIDSVVVGEARQKVGSPGDPLRLVGHQAGDDRVVRLIKPCQLIR